MDAHQVHRNASLLALKTFCQESGCLQRPWWSDSPSFRRWNSKHSAQVFADLLTGAKVFISVGPFDGGRQCGGGGGERCRLLYKKVGVCSQVANSRKTLLEPRTKKESQICYILLPVS